MQTPKSLFVGKLCRDYFITADEKPVLDTLGGNLPYAAVGSKLWEASPPPGLLARVGEDYPQGWLDDLARRGFDTRGVRVLPEAVDVRNFYAYTAKATRVSGDPILHFARLGIPFPKVLLGYRDASNAIDSRTQLNITSLRQGDIPDDYMSATAAHLCPVDYLTHSLMPAVFRQAGFTTVTLDPAPGYMNPTFWNDVPALITGLTAFLPAEEELRSLFQGRSEDLWEMAAALAAYGCDFIVIKRGERGQLLYDATTKSRWELPAYPVQIVNPTGAGDAFCGGFLAGYRRTYDPVEAVLHGNISAAIVAEGVSPFFALDVLPSLPQARLDNLRQSIRKL
ncbi:MAG: carbohydrate kinase family protein [Chloroflexota bacterium]